jgi:formylglycine-generating enzyme required for sulfatase activity
MTYMRTSRKGRKIALLTGVALVVLVGVLAWVNRERIRFLLEFESLGLNAQGYPEFRHRKTDIVFVRLPGGEFWMGTSEDEGEALVEEFVKELGESERKQIVEVISAEQPRHKVTLRPFLIAKHEISQVEWVRVMRDNLSMFAGKTRPVERVSWEECQDFCRKTGLSLPSEAQWEYACRAGTSTLFAFGEAVSKGQANFDSEKTVLTDSFKPNGFGLHHMHGNVSEWCEDVYDREFYGTPEASEVNPACSSRSEFRVVRGGCWRDEARYCGSAARFRLHRLVRYEFVGFRPVFYPLP